MHLFSAMPINNKFKGFQVNFFVCGHPDNQGPTLDIWLHQLRNKQS